MNEKEFNEWIDNRNDKFYSWWLAWMLFQIIFLIIIVLKAIGWYK